MMPNDVERIAIQIEIQKDKEAKERVARLAAKIKMYAQQMKTSFRIVGEGLKDSMAGTGAEAYINKAVASLENVAPAANKAGKSLWSLNNLARTAIGTFEAMAIFFVTQFVGQAINKVIAAVTQLEQAFYKLTIAERGISRAGVDITPQELAAVAKEVTDTYVTISKIDSLKMVSSLAVLTKDLKLTAEQYKQLALSIPLVSQQAGVSIESATDQVITGLTKSGRGWADLGITVDAAIIRQRAVTDGLVESAEAYDKLTAEQKQQVEVLALINILQESTNQNLESQGEYLDSISGKTDVMNKLWKELSTVTGTTFGLAIKLGIDIINNGLKGMISVVLLGREAYVSFFSMMVTNLYTVQSALDGNIHSLEEWNKEWLSTYERSKEQMIAAMGGGIGIDTPTAEVPDIELPLPDDKLPEALEKMNDAIIDEQIKFGHDMEDITIDYERKRYDITLEYARKRADAETDYRNKVRDINSDYANEINDINQRQAEDEQKRKNDELEKEAEFQNKMRELKENYLMDLEDALHERDARAVLRLIKQYNLDKTQAERERALEREKSKRDLEESNARFARQRAEAERERQAKLAEARLEYQDKLKELAEQEKREREDAERQYQRKMEDLEREMRNRLAIVAANLIQEFNLTKDGLDAILSLYRTYYEEIAKIYAAMNAALSGLTPPRGGTPTPNRPQAPKPNNGLRPAGLSDGGNITSLNKNGADVNRIFASLGDGSQDSAGGNLALEVMLSPDLEARIVKNTLNRTAAVISRVQNSKVR